MSKLNSKQLIELLGLQPLPGEGGFYKETYRAKQAIAQDALLGQYPSARNYSTAIYYLLDTTTISAPHRLPSDEIFHFYLGDPVELFTINPKGEWQLGVLGNDLHQGQRPQQLIPGQYWQGARLQPGGTHALMGTTVAPGFEFDDLELKSPEEFAVLYPELAEQISSFYSI